MKIFSKLLLLLATLTLGGYLGILFAPHDLVGQAATVGSIFIIVTCAMAGLFIGGVLVLLWD
jgi:hypothetical protein